MADATPVFEPDDRYKGDFARTYFYMACTYQHYHWRHTYMLTNNDWKTLNDWSIDLLCRWARNDAVSDKEVDRNDAVQKCQNNRNPFIDFPELFEYIWGNRQGQVFYLSEAGMTRQPIPAIPNSSRPPRARCLTLARWHWASRWTTPSTSRAVA